MAENRLLLVSIMRNKKGKEKISTESCFDQKEYDEMLLDRDNQIHHSLLNQSLSFNPQNHIQPSLEHELHRYLSHLVGNVHQNEQSLPKETEVGLVEKSHDFTRSLPEQGELQPTNKLSLQPEKLKLLQSFQQPQVSQDLLEKFQSEGGPSYLDHFEYCDPLQNPNNFEDSEEDDDICNDSSDALKKTRGRTKLLKLFKRTSPKPIKLNDFGQPIGKAATTLSNFLGLMARNGQIISLSYKDWRVVPNTTKDIMWMIVKKKFQISEEGRDWVIMSIGKKWREFKSKLKKLHYDTHKTYEEKIAACDSRVHPKEWEVLVKYWDSQAGQKNIGDLAPLYPEVVQKSPSRNDLLSLLIKEKRTLLHCHGLGPIPNEFRKSKTTRADYIRMLSETKKEAEDEKRVMQEELADMKQMYEDMHNEMMTMKALVESIGKRPQILGEGISCIPQGHKLSGTALPHDGSPPNNGASSSHSSYEAPPTQVHRVKTILPRKVQVVSNIVIGTEVYLRSLKKPHNHVAQGYLLSKDPTTKVGGFELGPQYWEIQVDVPIVRNEPLLRPYGGYQTIGDAVGATIAWPYTFVKCK
uniref:Transposase Tnp1/En/Spm-like domain-containing protein n=1 Tax=Ananas comosus var. bracteatus TaxID=296719 RepID=A0A6V7P1S8_ANACO|nr:unnamed protein product [Ananas comosus var. bracteatus]